MQEMMQLGVAYYPDYIQEGRPIRTQNGQIENLDFEGVVKEDFLRMKKNGISSVRIGEFSWSFVEPCPGETNLGPFLKVLDLAEQMGLEIMMCTPTATPPHWLIQKYPDILPKTKDGYQIPFGGRRHYDPANDKMMEESCRITELYAKAFGSHPAVKAWQTDNELGNHGSAYLYTEAAKFKFQSWLEQKYEGDIRRLNGDWFTNFWSQCYLKFSDVSQPMETWAGNNPHQELDFRRFNTSIYREFQSQQIQIIKKHSPGRRITHNITPMFFDLCLWELSEDLDFVGYDHYQMGAEPRPYESSMQFNLMRSLKGGSKFSILEQQPVQVNWQKINRRFSMDWLFLWGMQAAFCGAESFHYFSWRRFEGGGEQYHDAVLPHDLRVEVSDQEVVIQEKAEYLQNLQSEFDLSEFPNAHAQVVLVHDMESLWSHDICAQSEAYKPTCEIERVQKLCSCLGLGLDMVKSLEDLGERIDDYQLVVLPGYAFELSSHEKKQVANFVEKGGHVLSFPRTGMKKRNNQMSEMPHTVFSEDDFFFQSYGALLPEEFEKVYAIGQKTTLTGEVWAEKIQVKNPQWKVIGKFSAGLYKDFPAMIQRGDVPGEKGGFTHLCFCPQIDQAFLEWFCTAIPMKVPMRASADSQVQIFPMKLAKRQFFGIVNFSERPSLVSLGKVFKKSLRISAARLAAGGLMSLERKSLKDIVNGEKQIPVEARQALFLEVS